MRKALLIMVFLAGHAAAHAADRQPGPAQEIPASGSLWQDTSLGMPAHDYHQSIQHNQKVVRQTLKAWSERIVDNHSPYDSSIMLLGTATSLAISDQRYRLNRANTVGLVLRDSTRSNRSLLIEYKKSW